MGWVDRKYRERQDLFIAVCCRFAFDAEVHIGPSRWIRNFHCHYRECDKTRFYIWDYGKDITHQKLQCNLHTFATVTEDHIPTYKHLPERCICEQPNTNHRRKHLPHSQRTLPLVGQIRELAYESGDRDVPNLCHYVVRLEEITSSFWASISSSVEWGKTSGLDFIVCLADFWVYLVQEQ